MEYENKIKELIVGMSDKGKKFDTTFGIKKEYLGRQDLINRIVIRLVYDVKEPADLIESDLTVTPIENSQEGMQEFKVYGVVK